MFVKLGSSIGIPLSVKNASGVSTNASGTPTVNIYGADFSSSLISSKSMVKTGALAANTGIYGLSQSVTAASGFAAGYSYVVQMSYRRSGGSNALVREIDTLHVG